MARSARQVQTQTGMKLPPLAASLPQGSNGAVPDGDNGGQSQGGPPPVASAESEQDRGEPLHVVPDDVAGELGTTLMESPNGQRALRMYLRGAGAPDYRQAGLGLVMRIQVGLAVTQGADGAVIWPVQPPPRAGIPRGTA